MKACADKLKREISEYGCPPKFPEDEEEDEPEPTPSDGTPVDKSKGKKVIAERECLFRFRFCHLSVNSGQLTKLNSLVSQDFCNR